MYSIQVKNLSKSFKDVEALKNINLKIKKGEIFGLLGPNGAGKTTLISILTTILKPSSGSAIICGFNIEKDPQKVRQNIGVVFQEQVIDDSLTVFQNLDISARLYGLSKKERENRIKMLLKLADLEKFSNKKVELLSGGTKRKVEIVRGLINNPKLLFLDEPTLGLDPKIRIKIWDYIKKLNRKQKITIVLATHYLEEAETLCDRVGIINEGKLIKIGGPRYLKKELKKKIINKKINLYDVFMEYTK